jgi:hypothetical protein
MHPFNHRYPHRRRSGRLATMFRIAACLLFVAVGLCAQQEHHPAAVIDSSYGNVSLSVDDSLFTDEEDATRNSDVCLLAGLGVSTGGGFGDALTTELITQGYVSTGRMLFLNIEVGLEFKASDRFYLVPRMSWLHTTLNRQTGETSWNDDLIVFSMLTCGIGCRYYIRETLPYTFYVQGDGGFMMAASKIADVSFSSDVFSAGVLAGYAYSWKDRAVGFELGYRSIPVSHPRTVVEYINGRQRLVSEKTRKDFGGIFLNVIWQLHLFE